jgi:hypothetical protein
LVCRCVGSLWQRRQDFVFLTFKIFL